MSIVSYSLDQISIGMSTLITDGIAHFMTPALDALREESYQVAEQLIDQYGQGVSEHYPYLLYRAPTRILRFLADNTYGKVVQNRRAYYGLLTVEAEDQKNQEDPLISFSREARTTMHEVISALSAHPDIVGERLGKKHQKTTTIFLDYPEGTCSIVPPHIDVDSIIVGLLPATQPGLTYVNQKGEWEAANFQSGIILMTGGQLIKVRSKLSEEKVFSSGLVHAVEGDHRRRLSFAVAANVRPSFRM